MVGPGPSAAASERQRKLQEYLAAKGKLKDQNVKPYLKAKNICPNPPPFKPTIRPQKDVTNHAVLPIKATMPINIKLQPTTTNITGSQKPKLEPPKLPGKRLTSRCVPSNPNCKPSSKSGPTTGKLSGKPIKPPNTQKVETAKRQESDRGNAVCTDSVANTHGKNKYLDGFLKETNKENLSQPLVETERKPDSEICTIHKQKTNCYTQSRSSLAPKQVLGKSSVSTFVLKDRVNRQFDGKTQIRTLPVKSQQLSKVADFARPKEKAPRTVPSHFTQTVSRTQASKKPVAQDRKDIKVNRTGRPNETRFLSCTVTEQKLKHPKAPHLLQGGCNRHTTIRPDPKAMPPPRRPQTSCVLQKPRARSQKLNLTGTPSVRGNRTNSTCSNILQQKAQTVNSKFKKAFPQNHFLSKTTTKTRADITTIKERGALSETQTHPNIKRKTTTVDRRKQLEEWQKSKGKTYKRPPMEIKRKRKIIEEMNISFWKRIEEEEEEKKAQLELSNKINNTLTECLQLIEEGVLSNEIYSILSSIPKAENFAKYWICKAKLLASKSTFDVIGLYEEAIKNGATPIHELREVVLSILQDPSRTTEGISSDSLAAENNIISQEKEQVAETPKQTTEQDNPGIKLQVAPIPRISGMPEVQDMKLITPVRRSTRIERAVSRYPEMLQEHGLVVASLDELLEVEEADCFIFRKNDALPITLGFKTPES